MYWLLKSIFKNFVQIKVIHLIKLFTRIIVFLFLRYTNNTIESIITTTNESKNNINLASTLSYFDNSTTLISSTYSSTTIKYSFNKNLPKKSKDLLHNSKKSRIIQNILDVLNLDENFEKLSKRKSEEKEQNDQQNSKRVIKLLIFRGRIITVMIILTEKIN